MSSSRDSILIAEAFKALSKAVKRKAYESDSDDYIEQPTNRGGKLKKRARFVHQGQLGPPNGPATYKEIVEHAGYQRTVISRNPPLIDEEGYEIDSEDDQERVVEAQAAADEINPYASIRLEEILAPLTSSSDLANHVTLSRPFLSTALTELATQGLHLMHKESEALWKVRPLLTRLCGDHTWASCDMMLGSNDEGLFNGSNSTGAHQLRATSRSRAPTGEAQKPASPIVNGERPGTASDDTRVNGSRDKKQKSAADKTEHQHDIPSADVTMEDLDASNQAAPESGANGEAHTTNGDKAPETTNGHKKKDGDQKQGPKSATNGDLPPPSPGASKRQLEPGKDNPKTTSAKPAPVKENGHATEKDPGKQTGAASAPQEVNGARATSALTDRAEDEVINPFFLAPQSAYPDRDAGLPQNDAEEVRRLLQLYVQKQEEVCRGTKELYEGLLRADRLRKTVLKWSKAEAHCGANRDMSDGEDWYDKDEWGLTEDLKKGQDEEEEDTTRDQPKKTRNRR